MVVSGSAFIIIHLDKARLIGRRRINYARFGEYGTGSSYLGNGIMVVSTIAYGKTENQSGIKIVAPCIFNCDYARCRTRERSYANPPCPDTVACKIIRLAT